MHIVWTVIDVLSQSILVDSQNPGRDRPGQQDSGTGPGTKRDRAEKDILKQEKDVLKQENDVQKQQIWSFF